MQFLNIIALAGVAQALVATTTCNANNCLRQVRATNFPSRSGTADCSIYQSATAVRYVATTVTGASDVRAVTPFATTPIIPAYASACGDDAEYRSACSCIGQTSAATPSGTVTITLTATSSGGIGCTLVKLQATAGPVAGDYFYHSGSDTSGTEFLQTTSNPATAQIYEYRDGRFYRQGSQEVLQNAANEGQSSLFFDRSFDSTNAAYSPLNCFISKAGALACVLERGTVNSNTFSYFTNGLSIRFGPAFASNADQQVFTPKAVCAV